MEEDGIRLALTIVDTPGFGDNINNEGAYVKSYRKTFSSSPTIATSHSNARLSPSFTDILAYIEKQFDDVLQEESRIKRNRKSQDKRVHVLLYFIPPTGHS